MQELITKTIIFRLQEQEYGASIDQIRSIERMQEITALPQTSKFIKGIINLRGEVIPIIDLRTRLGMEELSPTDQTRILLANVREIRVGLVVDEATDVLDINPELIENTPDLVKDVDHRYLKGVAKLENRGMLLLLNLDYVLNHDEISEVKQAVE
ncbi:chemotaxis protein CheW [Gracilibacillus sp. YIM 98692]|uniref:chemotaxis protein CheW n=1 Tax=Gracilibacillus sp. YIM 98692 TaxID=2663532 RepID=UPI0013D898D8|nr:chemotaxis protein CheW [Gracilibacillus sp. YIM 98692]